MLSMECRLNTKSGIRQAILDNISKFLAENRYTISRLSDSTFRVNSQADNVKSKAKSNAQAYQIAQNMIARVNKEYMGHVAGYISETSPYEPITVTFIPSDAYINHEFDKNNQQGQLFQTSTTESSKASPSTISRVKEFLQRNNIDIKLLSGAYNTNAIANLSQNLIELAENKENVALTEEAAHFAVAMIKQGNPSLYRQMLNKIGSYQIYHDIMSDGSSSGYLANKAYQTPDGKLDVVKLKEEAMGKVLAEYIIKDNEGATEKPELIAQTLSWWEQIKNWICNLLKIAGFNPFEEAAKSIPTLSGDVEGGQLYQLSEAQDELKKKLDHTDSIVEKVIDANAENEDESNFYRMKDAEGNWVKIGRVTDIVGKFKKQLFGSPRFTEEQKKYNTLLRDTGVNGHQDLENILHRYIDSEGKLKATPDDRPQVSMIDPNDRTFKTYSKLESYISDLLHSPELRDAVFYPEEIILDPTYQKQGQAGTIDLIAQTPDGRVHIFDWKFIGNNSQEDLASWKKGAFQMQIGRYVEILRSQYGVKEFGNRRAIPILMDFKSQRNIQGGVKQFLSGIAIGSVDSKKIEDLKLLPVPVPEEETGIAPLDKQIKRLNALYNKYKTLEKPKTEEEKSIKRDVLESIRSAIRIIQTKQDMDPLADAADEYLKAVDLVVERYNEIRNFDIKSQEIDNKQISQLLMDIMEARAQAEVYAPIGDELTNYTDDPALKTRMDQVSKQIRLKNNELLEIFNTLTNEYVGKRNDVLGLLDAEVTITGLNKLFTGIGRMDNAAMQAMVRIYKQEAFSAQAKALEFNKEVEEILKNIPDRAKAQQLLFKHDSKGRRVHQLIDVIDSKFGDEFRKHTGADLEKWLKENIDYEAYMKEAEQKMSTQLERATGPNAQAIKEQILARWDPKHPLFLTPNTLVWKYAKEKWQSKEYQAIKKNKHLLDLYNKAQELNEYAAKIGYIDYSNMRNFVPFFKKGLLGQLLTGGIGNSIQDSVDNLYREENKTLGIVDDLSGQRRYILPRAALRDTSREKTDEKGVPYRDYSTISDDIGQALIGFSRLLHHYEAMDNIIGQVEALRWIEQTKSRLQVNKFNKPIRNPETGKFETEPDNKANAKIFEDFEQYLIYSNKYPITETDTDTGLGKAAHGVKNAINYLSEKMSGKKLFGDQDNPGPASLINTMETLNRGTQLKIMSLSPITSLSNWFGLQIQAASQNGKYFRFGEWEKNQLYFTMQRFRSREEKDMWASLIDTFLPLNEDPNREMWKKMGINKVTAENVQDFLYIGMRKPEFWAQMGTFKSLLQNFIVQDGKLIPISDYVRNSYEGLKQPRNSQAFKDAYKLYTQEKAGKIAEAKKNSVMNTIEFKDGKLSIPGFDLSNHKELEKFSTLAKTISQSISGQMGETEASRAQLDIFMKSIMVFKNWIPKLISTRFGNISKTNDVYDPNSYEIGKVRLFWHVFMEHMNFRINAIRNILQTNEKGLVEIDKLYTHYKQEYENRTGKEFTMGAAEFNDMIKVAIKNQVREVCMLLAMAGLFISTGFMQPPDDPQQKAVFNTTKRAIDQAINELSFFYNPANLQGILGGTSGIFPAMSMLTDAESLITNFAGYTTGIDFKSSTTGSDEVRAHEHPIKYAMRLFPGAHQFVNYMTVFAPDMAKEMEIKPPPSTNY